MAVDIDHGPDAAGIVLVLLFVQTLIVQSCHWVSPDGPGTLETAYRDPLARQYGPTTLPYWGLLYHTALRARCYGGSGNTLNKPC